MERFPFALPCLVLEELVAVVAVAHVRGRPGYWQGLIQSRSSVIA
jgi:hypothetical protein